MKETILTILFVILGVLAFSQDLEPFKDKNGKMGYMNENKKVIIEAKYDNAFYFSEGLGVVELNGKFGAIDSAGEEALALRYDQLGGMKDGFIYISRNGKSGFANRQGEEVILGDYSLTSMVDGMPFPMMHDGYTAFCEGSQCGVLDSLGNIALSFIYDDIKDLAGSFAIVEKNEKLGIADLKRSKEITPLLYDEIYGTGNTPFVVRVHKKWGFVNLKGEEITSVDYDYVRHFEYEASLTTVNRGIIWEEGKSTPEDMGGKWGVINISGKEIIPVIYDAVTIWSSGSISAELNGEEFEFDKNGTLKE